MKTLATIALSLIAILASLVLVLSTVCAFNGGFLNRSDRSSYVFCAIIAFAVLVAAMWAIAKLNRKS